MMKTRYKFIKDTINNLFIKLSINSYPIELMNIFSKIKNCRVVSYSKHMNKYNLTEAEVIEHFGSDEGCTIYNFEKDRYLVFYNDLNIYYKKPARRRWTLAHELGHVLLCHHTISNKTKIFRNKLTDAEYVWMEAEANRFASLLLANPLILHKLNIKTNLDIVKICRLSEEASIYRYKEYLKWKKYQYINSSDIKILFQFHDFIYKKTCLDCGYGFVSETAKHCPICGKILIRGDGNMIYNDGFKLDSNGKALKCPSCENEQFVTDGVYCRICGTYLINKCTNNDGIWEQNEHGYNIKIKDECGMISPGNARFCENCGEPTTFYTQGLLKDWKTNKTLEEMNNETSEQVAAAINEDDIAF
ncbi:ImmA/IrrE family metallo-endopeptidase [Clostridium sporogenes]|uniref:ImmA/IrrE family metallo-endopeptidase n=2 Tax=Clostridium TaxID=1485 RepID=UPI000774094B|nr:ImmA/IrrE family metallo-endopeptidase [Clostridium sporogenes]AUM96360.1 hypothetical protein RSJ11_14880 [Clostridium sporogenes]AVQ53811.1 ImmA/IrrE family metallo-endopeptidase [Clostridium botulinum]